MSTRTTLLPRSTHAVHPSRPTAAGLRILLAASVLAAACQSQTPAPDSASVESIAAVPGAAPVTLAIPGLRNDHVSLAAHGPFVVAAWAAISDTGVTNVYSATSQDAGATFNAAVRINSVDGEARANGEQPPRVTLVAQPDGTPHVVVLWIARRTSGTVLMTTRSLDGGQTYGASELVPGTDAAGNRGWHAVAAGHAGAAHALWLDHRRLAPAPGATPHHHATTTTAVAAPAAAPAATVDTVATAQRSDLYFAVLGSASTPQPVTAGVCYCCKTAMAHGADGAIYLAWRHVYPGNMRDIAMTVSRDGGRTFSAPVRVSEDGWSIAGCPDDGPAMAVDGVGRVHVVWPTMVTTDGKGQKRLFHAMTSDGLTFSPRTTIPHAGDAHHPQIAVTADNRVVVMWDEFAGDVRTIASAAGVVDPSGRASFQVDSRPVPNVGRYPVVVATGSRAVAAWVSGDGTNSVVQVAPLATSSLAAAVR